MARFADAVLFAPTAGGTADFTVSAAVQGFMTPALSGAPSGVYKYRAESVDLTQWEMGEGTYTSGTGVFTRTTVLYNSSGTGTAAGQSGAGTKINFTVAPQVGIVQLTSDTLGLDQAMSWTGTQKSQARANAGATVVTISDTAPASPNDGDLWYESDTGSLYFRYNDGTSTQWVGISTNANLASVLYTSQSLTPTQKAQARANIDALKKNYIINGAMQVSQENGATAGTVVSYYPVDQFFMTFSNAGTQTAQQVVGYTPAGSPNRLRVTATAADAAVAAGDLLGIVHRIEGYRAADLKYGTTSAKTITIQFGVKAPAGTYCIGIRNGANSRSYVAEYTISAGEANTDVVKSATLTLDLTGTWATDNTTGLDIFWCLMGGSTFQAGAGAWSAGNFFVTANQFNFMGTTNNVFELFDVGLYEGSAAPAFQVPDYAAELIACQRYYEVSEKRASTPLGSGFCYNTSITLCDFRFKVEKRTAPTFVAAGAASDYSVYRAGANNAIDTLPTMDAASSQAAQVRHTHSTAPFTAGQAVTNFALTANAQYRFNARL